MVEGGVSRIGSAGRFFRRMAAGLCIAKSVGLVLFLVFLEYAAESFPVTAFLIYLPPLIWVIPAAGLLGFALGLRLWRTAGIAGGAVFFILVFYMGLQVRIPHPHGRRTLTLVTCNTGQDGGTTPEPFIRLMDADVVVFEDRRYYPGLMKDSRWDHRALGEFLIFSRFPILRFETLPGLVYGPGRHPFAVRAELMAPEERRIAVYAFHLPSPRQGIEALRGRGIRTEWTRGGGILSWKNWRRFGRATRLRLAAGRALADVLAHEKLPWIAAGDMNTPDHGVLYHVFGNRFQDAFERAGLGYGFTFPGRTRNPLALFGPWMRLDYVFCSGQWLPRYCRVEPGRPSQHRAVAVRLWLR